MPSLEFKGKSFVYAHHLSVPFRELIIDEKKSLPMKGQKPSLEDNLIIHGDNLHALKALLPVYAGKVDCIFIDPPYNTGNEGWCYNDNVRSPLMREWLKKSANPVDKEDLERHDKWLCMMWPRMQLLRELLAETGTIIVAIDDNEHSSLKLMMDEIWGRSNYIASICWRAADSSNNDATQFSADHNYLVAYSKSTGWTANLLERNESDNAHYRNPDNDPEGPWFPGNLSSPNPRENLRFNVTSPKGVVIKPPANGWRWKRETLESKIISGEIIFSQDGTRLIRKTYLSRQKGLAPSSLWIDLNETGHNRNAKYELNRIFGELTTSEQFKTPKPTKLLAKILTVFAEPNALVLDSFAGSGTTAHAVLAANKKDQGCRKFILVETEDYANTLTAERVRRVMQGYKFEGTQREELMREPLSWTKLKNPQDLLEKAESLERSERSHFDHVTKQVEDGALILTGERKVTEKVEGLGGSFTFVELGTEMSIDKLLLGGLPTFEALAKYVFFTATGQTLSEVSRQKTASGLIGETDLYRVHLHYQPDKPWLQSNDAALTEKLVDQLVAENTGKKKLLVFAAAKFMGQRELSQRGIDFCQLPYAIHRILGD